MIDDLPSLLWATQMGTIELHPFQSTISRPNESRAVVFDLDPGPGCHLRDCARAALEIRGSAVAPLHSFVKASGVKRLHLLVPLNGGRALRRSQGVRARGRERADGTPSRLVD